MDESNLSFIAERLQKKIKDLWNELDFGARKKIKKKSGFRDIVTDADYQMENWLKTYVNELLPEASFLGEETKRVTNGELLWILDPIDGTTNFSRMNPHFSTSIALVDKGSVLLGITYDPSTNEMFAAMKNQGAYLNGNQIHTSNVDKLTECSVHTGLQYSSSKSYERLCKRINKAISKCRALRITGSACLDLCYVSAGRAEIFWEEHLKPWDVAAGIILVQEAGGNISSCLDETFDLFNPNIYAANGNSKITDDFFKEVLNS
ncbi:MAG: inositol monophosphatase [Kosmotoga sp.]|nr:MAG: inositol monophosphatase [Kosmotoga sp.]